VFFEKYWVNKCVEEEDEGKISPSDYGVIVEYLPKFLPRSCKKEDRKYAITLVSTIRNRAEAVAKANSTDVQKELSKILTTQTWDSNAELEGN
jgi:hypothetical protein